ncbi:Acetyl xylan esterase [Magnetococcus marinus MC-1]|uniref:Acetyl xylan esterase n=1 Tax=Magnetococcus marinus (strain ATCC BAA-1437 / JCM 17883 / MC-1) TaxID=156889 RepID=A0LAM5_MAGMM|nr:acetylxylan esterase [Magnetococcus marinus]ABK45018.1 Acetyl xylan esterase [Magnetococcus marinus MC-1]
MIPNSLPFDASHGYDQACLLCVGSPPPPDDFAAFWQARYARALQVDPRPMLKGSNIHHEGYHIYDCGYTSTDHFGIGGWLLIPKDKPVKRGFIISHGYSGREGPDLDLPVPAGSALLFPCCRGISRSAHPPISTDPYWHVLHDIHRVDRYILGGCVEDIWLGVSTLLTLYPWIAGHIGYMGISFGGGIGAMAIPWDHRITRGHLNIPSFGNHPLRVTLPSHGSSASVARFQAEHGTALQTLRYYDAATAARFITIPMHLAVAAFDPVVPPPGQYAILNAIPSEKHYFALTAGHHPYPKEAAERRSMRSGLKQFFATL